MVVEVKRTKEILKIKAKGQNIRNKWELKNKPVQDATY